MICYKWISFWKCEKWILCEIKFYEAHVSKLWDRIILFYTVGPIRRFNISREGPESTAVYRVVHQRLAEGGRTSRQRLTPREIESKGPSVSPIRQSSPRSCREVANHHLATFTTLDSPRLQSFQARLRCSNTRRLSSPFVFFPSAGILQRPSRKRSFAVLAGSLPT